jgi:nitric oxide reductase subunit C
MMQEILTKSAARNIFYGGSIFFLVVFLVLTGQSYSYVVNVSTDEKGLTDSVARGKRIWEKNACIDCHTILGEGAYYAPELGNVWVRYGGKEDPNSAREALKGWMKSQPSGVEGRRQMPQFHLTDPELDDLISFLEWTSKIDTQGWPPKTSG